MTRSILSRMVVTAPVISSTVSPRTRSAMSSAPICDGVASPAIICSKAFADSSRVKAVPVATLPMSALKIHGCALNSPAPAPVLLCLPRRLRASGRGIPGGGDIEEILQHQVPVIGRNALGMELHAMDGQPAVGEAHDQAVGGLRGDTRVRAAGLRVRRPGNDSASP